MLFLFQSSSGQSLSIRWQRYEKAGKIPNKIQKKSHSAKRNGLFPYFCTILFQLSQVLNGANHLRSVRVLIVIPSNNLNE